MSPRSDGPLAMERNTGKTLRWDAAEVEQLYTLLEQQVVPEFYDRDAQGLPSRWLERVRESMARLTPEFSASRAIREYTNDHYLPAAAGYAERAARDGKLGADLVQWQHTLADQWKTLRFGKMTSETKDGQHRFQVQVMPGGLHAGPVPGSNSTPRRRMQAAPIPRSSLRANPPQTLRARCSIPYAARQRDLRATTPHASCPLMRVLSSLSKLLRFYGSGEICSIMTSLPRRLSVAPIRWARA